MEKKDREEKGFFRRGLARLVQKARARLRVLLWISSKGTGWGLIGAIRFYQKCISPFKPPSCRFFPSCSQYTLHAIRKRGPLWGILLGAARIFRCHPFSRGGYDPVPEKEDKSSLN